MNLHLPIWPMHLAFLPFFIGIYYCVHLSLQKAEHIRQHDGHYGEVRDEPRGSGGREDALAHGGEEKDGSAALQYATEVHNY